MINIILKGWLGNSLFQYAVGRHLAIKNNTAIRLITKNHINRYDLLGRKIVRQIDAFNIEPLPHTSMLHEKIGEHLGIHWSHYSDRVYSEKRWGFDPEVLSLKDGVYLDGYFQSEKYFKDIEHIIRDDLQFKKDSLGREAIFYKKLITERNSVGLHIRRADYVTSPFHNVCTMNYFRKSIEHIQKQTVSPYFFVFSDDIEWCAENLHIPNCRFVNLSASKKKPITDLQLMSLCRHNIISNSTFSWWAAWLNGNVGKIVVAPNRWFNGDSMNTLALQDTIPDNWVRMDF